MKRMSRSLFVMAALYGLLFVIGDLYLARQAAPVWVAVMLPIVIIGLKYLLAPVFIRWVLPIEWDDNKTLIPARNHEFLSELCQRQGLPLPRIGIIRSSLPNAFTFGRVPSDASIVLTSGLLDGLELEEVNAVIAHEAGHIKHWDFLVMSVAALVPMMLYQLYAFTRRVKDDHWIAYAAYAAYWVSEWILLSLSRVREYDADNFAATSTNAPQALSSALVKIGYGMVKLEADQVYSMKHGDDAEKKRARQQMGVAGAIGVLGISSAAGNGAFALTGMEGDDAAAVMKWDIVNPWARVYEMRSTHPITAFRIKALSQLATSLGQPPQFKFDFNQKIEWQLFPLELALWVVPWIFGVAFVVTRSLGHRVALFGLADWISAACAIAMGSAWCARIAYKYYGEFEPAKIKDLLEATEISDMRPRAVWLEGKVIGRGGEDAFWIPDMVLKQESNIMFLQYPGWIPFARLAFGASTIKQYLGESVVVEGWYRRSGRPYVEIRSISVEGGKSHRPWVIFGEYLMALVTTAVFLWLAIPR